MERRVVERKLAQELASEGLGAAGVWVWVRIGRTFFVGEDPNANREHELFRGSYVPVCSINLPAEGAKAPGKKHARRN